MASVLHVRTGCEVKIVVGVDDDGGGIGLFDVDADPIAVPGLDAVDATEIDGVGAGLR